MPWQTPAANVSTFPSTGVTLALSGTVPANFPPLRLQLDATQGIVYITGAFTGVAYGGVNGAINAGNPLPAAFCPLSPQYFALQPSGATATNCQVTTAGLLLPTNLLASNTSAYIVNAHYFINV